MANPKRRRGELRWSRSPIRVPDVTVPLGREENRPVLLPGVALAAGILLFLFLLRFAVDILLWVLVLVLFALVLHAFMQWLARSELLSAPWLLIIALTVGAAIWMLWPESSFQQGLDVTHHLPSPFAQAIEWAERRNLTRRALVVTPAPAGGREATAGGRTVAPSSEPASTNIGAATLSVSIALTGATRSRVGEPVALVASVSARGRSAVELAGTVQFFDGFVPLGEATLQPAGGSGRASLTVTGLSVGQHRITASFAGATSAELAHTVAGG